MNDLNIVTSSIRRRWKPIAIGSVFVVVTNLLHVVIPLIVGNTVDLLRETFIMRDLLLVCGLILFLEFTKGLSRFLMRYIIIGTSWKIENDIRTRIYNHLLKLPLAYYNRSRTGDIIARITNDLTAVRAMVGPAVMYSLNVGILLPSAFIFMFAMDSELAFYGIAPFPLIALTIYLVGKKIHRLFKKVQESYSDISAHVQENLNGIRVIKAYTSEKHELNTLKNLSLAYVKNNRRIIQLQSFFHPFLDILASTGVIIVLWVGGKKVVSGETTLGTLVSLIMYIGLLVWPAIALGWIIGVFQRGTASARRITEILEEETERQGDSADLQILTGAISVRDVHFSYNGDDEALKGVSFNVKSGETLAIVGRTGSGKSTLLDILSGAYSVKRGVIFYDGVDINDLPLVQLRFSIALVPQETFLFSETVAENIAFGDENASGKDIKAAAAFAAINEEIEAYPDGYETVLGERGITVSGGQRQRIAIARALISNAPILFFDDCLSNVDTATEMKILKNIRQIISNKTALIVTQRLGAIKGADEILYMKNGVVIERGNHEELMTFDGEYAALFVEQESLETLE
ncbi:MAG: ABC transporter ATP-binding protein [Candidatus Latescibacteria bacterium]|jgi:ATP-binding cassette, subfamily B, multidrug efflux pump|nr:ABC transporter ATP-binding protein [Candidatus Latescibacterota bacterium]